MKTIDISSLEQLATPLNKLIIIDIRTPSEYAKEHIPNSINIPMDQLQTYNMSQWQDKTLVFHCKSGHRTQQAQPLINSIICKEALCLNGGIEAWKKNNNPVISNPKAPLELMRQVQIIVGLMILIGIILAYLVSPYFILLTLFAGIGLLTAGITGFCGMANLLMLLPYNKPKHQDTK